MHTFCLSMEIVIRGFPGGSEGKASACIAGDLVSIPGLGRSPGEGNGNPLQYSCLENPMENSFVFQWKNCLYCAQEIQEL